MCAIDNNKPQLELTFTSFSNMSWLFSFDNFPRICTLGVIHNRRLLKFPLFLN